MYIHDVIVIVILSFYHLVEVLGFYFYTQRPYLSLKSLRKNALCQPSPCRFRGQRLEVCFVHTKPALEVPASLGCLALPAPLPLKRAGQSGLLHSKG